MRLKYFFENRALTPPGWLLHWAYLAELDPVERSFATVYRSLHWLGEKPYPAQTPTEAAAVLTERLPNVSKEINFLLHEYQRQLYSQVHEKRCVLRFNSAGEHLEVYLGLDINRKACSHALMPNDPYCCPGNRYDKRTTCIVE